MNVLENLAKLRQEMAKENIDMYLVPTDDFHCSEYVDDHFKARAFITGFTGSQGTAIILKDEAYLWTDGRYFIQAENQLKPAGGAITLMKMGEDGVPTVDEFVERKLKKGITLGFDGRCVMIIRALKYKKIAEANHSTIITNVDLIDRIWTSRPKQSQSKLWILEDKYSGEQTTSKLQRIRDKILEQGANAHLITSLYDIAWILNLRAADIESVPVFFSYLFIEEDKCTVFLQDNVADDRVVDYLKSVDVKLEHYEDIEQFLLNYRSNNPNARVLINELVVNYNLYTALFDTPISDDEQVDYNTPLTPIIASNPSVLMRSIKNETEIRNTKEAHVLDGLAVTRFIKWVKESTVSKNSLGERFTEYDASEYLDNLRKNTKGYIDLSFSTISAYGPNAAMMHYSATRESAAELKAEGFLLVDSGGHYLKGTTDITRTIALGPLTDIMKQYYTTVLKGHLRLMTAHFPKGVTGANLDVLSRGPIWDLGLDYRCGTGHGVGHILNVHEGPNAFRWQTKNTPAQEFIPGMITTDEPGLYIENEFGIRIENELLCVEDVKTEYAQFYRFDNLTYTPYEPEAILTNMLSVDELRLLNEYHKMIYDTLSPMLSDEERIWLKNETREL